MAQESRATAPLPNVRRGPSTQSDGGSRHFRLIGARAMHAARARYPPPTRRAAGAPRGDDVTRGCYAYASMIIDIARARTHACDRFDVLESVKSVFVPEWQNTRYFGLAVNRTEEVTRTEFGPSRPPFIQ